MTTTPRNTTPEYDPGNATVGPVIPQHPHSRNTINEFRSTSNPENQTTIGLYWPHMAQVFSHLLYIQQRDDPPFAQSQHLHAGRMYMTWSEAGTDGSWCYI